jgi:hypothetical protein
MTAMGCVLLSSRLALMVPRRGGVPSRCILLGKGVSIWSRCCVIVFISVTFRGVKASPASTRPSLLMHLMGAHAGSLENDTGRVAGRDDRHQRLLGSLAPESPVIPGLAGLHQVHDGVGYCSFMNDRDTDFTRVGEGLLSGHARVVAAGSLGLYMVRSNT